ncbi:hypothetical protein B4V02_09080 [Paenibacillus kribbensis]|uniref:Uncharacterized protein n=1 Tax=Paenibacillus kribbensis TaxID=172713 RepID=A0A222WM12_9BACL|nr:hypothetical protein [Paenibacillus kribbensis]ASR46821.1 hypothetical protein B4V02_09080 [Paenibacillus kribbensis]
MATTVDMQVVKSKLEQIIADKFAIGNERSAHIENCELEGEVLNFKVSVRSKEVKKERNTGIRITVFSITYDVRGQVNLFNPDPDDVKVCVHAPSPVNLVCVKASEIARFIMA